MKRNLSSLFLFLSLTDTTKIGLRFNIQDVHQKTTNKSKHRRIIVWKSIDENVETISISQAVR